ncbi:MAG: hypothetical protein JW765_09640 [Deltaproteobacteria bacterium]|nr:hypothetical protein [Candidatus Zymogenaceae bacterium]
MKPKTIITSILLLFVAASVVYLVLGEIGGKRDAELTPAVVMPDEPTAGAPDSSAPPGETLTTALPAEKASPDTYVNVYYFHGNYRCISCRTIEMYTREAVNEAFLTEMGDGSLHLKVLNMQDPKNEAYIDDFTLEYYIVVLEKVVDGKRVEWKKLEGVWDLYNDKPAFKKYVIGETRNYLKGI